MHDKPDLEAIHKALKNLPKSDERWKTIVEAGKIFEFSCRYKKFTWR